DIEKVEPREPAGQAGYAKAAPPERPRTQTDSQKLITYIPQQVPDVATVVTRADEIQSAGHGNLVLTAASEAGMREMASKIP
ncbi:hypothetical protein ACI3PL_28690, partial [Lacticaseibacillus paracasei]